MGFIPKSEEAACRGQKYHLVRLILRDLKLDVFGEMFPVPPELELEYVVATMSRIKNLQFLTMERRWNKSIIFVKEKISVRES
jgi:hypothetical protein